MSTGKKKISLAGWIFIALVLGCLLGWALIGVPGGWRIFGESWIVSCFKR